MSFERSIRALGKDRDHLAVLGFAVAIALFAGWVAWLTLARITVREVSDTARVEIAAPAAPLRVIAHYRSPRARARIAQEAPARFRVDGFPPATFGWLDARVVRAGVELDGRLRVELELLPPADGRVPVAPGMTGTVEIEIERSSPLALLMRAVGADAAGPSP